MGKKFKFLLSSLAIGTTAFAAASQALLYFLSDRSADLGFILDPDEETDSSARINAVLKEDYDWLISNDLKEYSIDSADGLKLRAQYLPAKRPSNRYVLLIHGFHNFGTREFCSISRFYHEEGFNCFIIDQRAHGKSEGKYITYGCKESDDCIRWLKFMKKEFGENIDIILHGVSMGAATVMLMSGKMLPNNVIFAISDCGYSTLKGQLLYSFEKHHMPASLSYTLFKIGAKLRIGFDPDKCLPIVGVEKSNIPILFIHGEDDEFVPFEMVYANYEACPSPVKKLVTVAGADHAQCFNMDDSVKDAILDMIERLM